MIRGVTVCKTSLAYASLQVPFQNLADGKPFANLQICNIADDVFGRETIVLKSCVFGRFYSRQNERMLIPE
jgi:hypothetical protein